MKYVKATAGENNSVVYEADDGKFYLWLGGTRAWRNNNPGNIRNGDFANRRNAIGIAGGFAVFPDYETGFAALVALLCTATYQQMTVEQAINRYAPPVENNTSAYVVAVEKQIGIPRTTPMSQLSENNLRDFAKAIERHEGYKEGIIQRI
ncbi:MAG: hypothetical protein FWE50_04215 [Alphaproteobacteria bacterium]|nr:hypothetical protein [Alphaproteobacteria bacterium]